MKSLEFAYEIKWPLRTFNGCITERLTMPKIQMLLQKGGSSIILVVFCKLVDLDFMTTKLH